jgi:1-acyl-sn-glycerol-3-phosphate acyltransferase
MWLAGFVFINRKDRAAAYRSIEKAGARVKKGRSVVVFPEGTRTDDGELQKFKRGGFVLAQSAGVPVIPVAIYGTRKVLAKNHFRVYPGHIAVCAGAPMLPPPAGEDLDAFIDQVRAEVARLQKQARALVEAVPVKDTSPSQAHAA